MKTPQAPLSSGLGFATTAREALGGRSLKDTVAIVTGGYAGIARVELVPMDLADPRSVDAFSETFLASKRPLHLLVNNAGIMAAPLARDARGFGVVDGRAPALNGSNLRAPLEGR